MKSRVAYTISRILLGLAFIFFGAVKFFPADTSALSGGALAFFSAMIATGYFVPFLGASEVLVGLLLVFNRAVPLAMVILAPIMLNIILFNLFLGPSWLILIFVGIPLVMEIYIMYCTWDAYKPLFSRSRVR